MPWTVFAMQATGHANLGTWGCQVGTKKDPAKSGLGSYWSMLMHGIYIYIYIHIIKHIYNKHIYIYALQIDYDYYIPLISMHTHMI